MFSVLFSLIDYEDEKAVRLVQEVHKEMQRDNFTIDTLLSAYERAAQNELPIVEKPESAGAGMFRLPAGNRALPAAEEMEDYEDDATLLERARYYLKGKKVLDVLEDINSGGIMERIRRCGKAPDEPKAFEPASLPLPVKPAFEYILIDEKRGGGPAEKGSDNTNSANIRRQNGEMQTRWLEGRKTQRGAEYAVDHFPLSIGKAAGSDVKLDASAVSSLHARLYEEGGHLFLEDMNSEHGTYLNGTLLSAYQKRPIKEGDILRFAREEFCLR